jgi:hypothetical protein
MLSCSGSQYISNARKVSVYAAIIVNTNPIRTVMEN